jgi:hypothetical protein
MGIECIVVHCGHSLLNRMLELTVCDVPERFLGICHPQFARHISMNDIHQANLVMLSFQLRTSHPRILFCCLLLEGAME